MPMLHSLTESTQNWASQRELECRFKPETGSTNDDAKTQALAESSAPVLFLTGHQTKGRGRGLHHWLDTGAGEALLATWSLEARAAPRAITAPRIGLAVYRAVTDVWPSLNWSLKAPNDLLLNGHKCAGLLVEAISDGHSHRLLVGIGLNVLNHPRAFTEATHLAAAVTIEEAAWFQFLDRLHEELLLALEDAQKDDLSEAVCRELAEALRANPSAKIHVQSVTPKGDLIYAGGSVPWTEI